MTDTPTRLTEEQEQRIRSLATFAKVTNGSDTVLRLLAEIDALRAERDDLQRSYDALATQANALENDREYNASLWQEMKAERDRLLAHGARLKEALAQAVVVVNAEHLDDPQEGTDDDAYEMAVDDCERALRKHVREALASSETGD